MKTLKFPIVAIIFGLCFTKCQNSGTKESPKMEVVKIGAILPLTGDMAKYGNWIKEGMDLALEEIKVDSNYSKKLEAIYEDDQCKGNLGANCMNKLATVDKVPFVIGSFCSSSVLAQAPIAEKEKTIILSEGLSPEISNAGIYTYRIIPTGTIYLDRLLEYFHQSNFKKCAVIYINNDFGVGMSNYFKKQIQVSGSKIVEVQSYEADNTNFKNQLLKISASKPDIVLLIGYEEAGYIIKQAKELNLKLKFSALDTFENDDVIKIAGDACNNVVYPHFFYENDTNNLALNNYQKKYYKKYGHLSDGFAAVSYDAVYLIAAILKDTPITADKSKILEKLNAISFKGVTGLTSFDIKGDAKKSIILKTVSNGNFVRYEK